MYGLESLDRLELHDHASIDQQIETMFPNGKSTISQMDNLLSFKRDVLRGQLDTKRLFASRFQEARPQSFMNSNGCRYDLRRDLLVRHFEPILYHKHPS